MGAEDAIALGRWDAQRSSCSRSSPGRGRVLRWDGRRGWGAGLRRLPCRRRLAALRRRAQDRRRRRPTGVCAAISRAFRRSPRCLVCGFLANASQIRSQRRHRDRHAPLREHRGDGRPAVALRAKGEDLGRQRANRLLLTQLGLLVRRNIVERLLQLQNRLRCELILGVHRLSFCLHELSLGRRALFLRRSAAPSSARPSQTSARHVPGSDRSATLRLRPVQSDVGRAVAPQAAHRSSPFQDAPRRRIRPQSDATFVALRTRATTRGSARRSPRAVAPTVTRARRAPGAGCGPGGQRLLLTPGH
jgi:hypothetical protein